jgi:hypothetical protein
MMAHADQWCISIDHVKEEGFEYGLLEELPHTPTHPHTHSPPHTHTPTHPLPPTPPHTPTHPHTHTQIIVPNNSCPNGRPKQKDSP